MVCLIMIAWLAFSVDCPGIGWTAAITALVVAFCAAFNFGVKLAKS